MGLKGYGGEIGVVWLVLVREGLWPKVWVGLGEGFFILGSRIWGKP